jgi:hypothetical protein
VKLTNMFKRDLGTHNTGAFGRCRWLEMSRLSKRVTVQHAAAPNCATAVICERSFYEPLLC